MELRLKQTQKIEFEAIDFTGKLSINGLSHYMQTIAAKHASKLGFNYYKNEERPKYYWILARAKYTIHAYPLWEEKISLETYPGGYDKLFAVRLFDIYDDQEKCIGNIIGDYILMDGAKERPVRIKGAEGPLAFLDFPYEGYSLSKLPLPEKIIKEEIRKAYYSEIDLNGHMNNAHYVKWCVDMLSLEQLQEMEIESLQINYNTSVTYGTSVKVILGENPEGGYLIAGNSIDDAVNYFIALLTLRAR